MRRRPRPGRQTCPRWAVFVQYGGEMVDDGPFLPARVVELAIEHWGLGGPPADGLPGHHVGFDQLGRMALPLFLLRGLLGERR